MRRRSSVWLVAVAHALTPPAGLRKLTRSVASPELLEQNDAVTFLQETGVPTFAADETWLKLDDAASRLQVMNKVPRAKRRVARGSFVRF